MNDTTRELASYTHISTQNIFRQHLKFKEQKISVHFEVLIDREKIKIKILKLLPSGNSL